MARTLFQKIWDDHVVKDLGDGFALIHVDRHIVHDLGGRGFVQLNDRGLKMRNPELTFATADHSVATLIHRGDESPRDNPFIRNLRENAERFGFQFFDAGDARHGIVHVIVPEQGLALPGMTLACGDSHSCTIGALGVMSWGIGQTELVHVLATQTSIQSKPKTMRIWLEGRRNPWLTAKDIVLHLSGLVGAGGGNGYVAEFAGPIVSDMTMEERFTLCNMAIEMGFRYALVAPDEKTFAYLCGRPFAPTGAEWELAVEYWRTLFSDPDADFDAERRVEVSDVAPQVTWGTSPQDVIPIDGQIPDPAAQEDSDRRNAVAAALDYVGLDAGVSIAGTPVDWVFIGSCTNGRLSDLELAASLARNRKVSPGVRAWVVPGSEAVRRAAEERGLDRIFLDAGFNWGSPGCSLCGGSGGAMQEKVPAGQRIASTSNRNFIGRQGPGSRTHLVSPSMAVAAAVTGTLFDVRKLGA